MNDNSQNRRSLLQAAQTIIVKVGSRVLSGDHGQLDLAQVQRLAAQLVHLADSGKQVVLVSSGAVASGVGKLGLESRPSSLAQLQAVAAVGQTHLIQTYEQYFKKLGRHAAQILLIADDLDDRARYLNVRNTLRALLHLGVIPVVNENDTVAVDELQTTFGDNDRLASMVAGLFSRPALIILSDVAGVFDKDPQLADAKVVSSIAQIDQGVMNLAVNRSTGIGKGGMASKLRAAQLVTQTGAPVFIAAGREPQVLQRLVEGEELGTVFLPQSRRSSPRKRWIGTLQVAGKINVDAGAEKALKSEGSSLLAIGITKVTGNFEKGEVVSIRNIDGHEIARGLSNYSSDEICKIRGLRSPEIGNVLGHCPYEAVIHRDNMSVSSSPTT